jgi:hypothetical protein
MVVGHYWTIVAGASTTAAGEWVNRRDQIDLEL